MKKEDNGSSLLNKWKNREKKKESRSKSISKAPKDAIIPLSRGQQRLYFLEQLYPKNPVYNSSEIYTFQGKLQVENLRESLQMIFAANHILRCSYHFVNGKAIQKFDDNLQLAITSFDLSDLAATDKKERQEELLTLDSLQYFNLDKAPLMRASILKLSTTETVLLITMHHIITDKWSMGIFSEQLANYYNELNSGHPIIKNESKIQYTDYAYWEQKKKVDEIQLNYWKQKLSGEIPTLELPTDHPAPMQSSFKGASHIQNYSERLSKRLLDLSKKLETTPYVLLLSVYYLLLFRYSGQKDILIGSPISTRNSKVLEDIIGFFDETIVLRTGLSPSMNFMKLVEKVRETTLEAFSNKDVPFDVLVKELKPERSLGTNPFFRVMFIYHDAPPSPSFGRDIDLSYTFFNKGISKFDLTLYISNEDGLLSSEFEYSTDLFKEPTIIRFQEHYRLLLEGITTNPDRSISEIPMLSQKEKAFFLTHQNLENGPFEHFTAIHQIIEEAAQENPDRQALVFGNESMTYKRLILESDIVAQRILSYSKGENEIVGLCTERSLEMITCLLGILKAGCAYLPLDPDYPSKRIEFMLMDSKVQVILTQKTLTPLFDRFKGAVLMFDDVVKDKNIHTARKLPVQLKDAIAYVIYTSGSTGKPKGVPITHNNIINSTQGRLTYYPENPSAFLLLSSIAFDSSKAGIFWTLCTGGTLVISEKWIEQDIDKIGDVILANSVSHTLMLPSLYKMILEYSNLSKLPSLTTVIVAGEACSSSLCDLHFKKLEKVSLYNEYGPTEATVWCTAYQISKENIGSVVPIGKPVANAEIYILSESLKLVPLGAIGGIYVGGAGLSGNYFNRPDLTGVAYINHPFEQGSQKKLYKTGDLGRYLKDGNIEFLGRADQQVKIRGHRIELNEIENILGENPMIDKVVVMMEESEREIIFDLSKTPDTEEIITHFESYLNSQQAEQLLESVESLKEEERDYLLRQMQ